MEKIRSIFILKKIFNNLDNKIKFRIIVHNNKLQKKLEVKINSFMIYSEKYLKNEDNKVIEYNSYNNKKIYEGKYTNGKRNGYGYEYNEKGEMIFRGEYIDGNKWKGTEYLYDEDTGKLILEYEYLNGIIDGEGCEYDK